MSLVTGLWIKAINNLIMPDRFTCIYKTSKNGTSFRVSWSGSKWCDLFIVLLVLIMWISLNGVLKKASKTVRKLIKKLGKKFGFMRE